jgi:hypothetical protein
LSFLRFVKTEAEEAQADARIHTGLRMPPCGNADYFLC